VGLRPKEPAFPESASATNQIAVEIVEIKITDKIVELSHREEIMWQQLLE